MPAVIAPQTLAGLLGSAWRRPGTSAHALADGLRALVVDGRLAVRTRIPSERALAPALGVSRGTVTRAYDRLRDDGYLVSARGAGSWLTLPGEAAVAVLPLPEAEPERESRIIDFSMAALPAPEPLLSEAAAAAARALGRHAATLGYAPAGLPDLREAVAARFTERGAPTSAEQIFITAGAQQGLHLLLALFCAPGERVLVDAPAYPRTLSALRTARLRPVAVPLGPAAWDVDAWARTLAAAGPRVAVTSPDFQNPTGRTMTRPERAELALACARSGAVLIADETTAELRLDGPEPLAPVAAFDPGGAVVTVGSMSKAGWAGLRLGWIRAAPRIIRELAAIRADVDLASPVLEQLVGIELLGRWDAVLESRRALLRPRRRALLAALPASWAVRRPAGGLSAWVRLPEPVSTRLASAAARAGLRITPGPSFSVDGTFEHHVRLPFTAPPEILEDGIGRLVELAAGLRDARVDPLDVTAAAV